MQSLEKVGADSDYMWNSLCCLQCFISVQKILTI
jgi:hypothetical protein